MSTKTQLTDSKMCVKQAFGDPIGSKSGVESTKGCFLLPFALPTITVVLVVVVLDSNCDTFLSR